MLSENFYAGKRVLITGGLGFIGSTLAIRLLELGARVTLVDGLIPDLGANYFNIESINDRVEVVEAELGDRSAVDPLVKGKDLIFNIGMHSCHLKSMTDPLFDLQNQCPSAGSFLRVLAL